MRYTFEQIRLRARFDKDMHFIFFCQWIDDNKEVVEKGSKKVFSKGEFKVGFVFDKVL